MKIAVCPGSFDPITVGHLDLVERAAELFDRVILCVMVNGEKHPMFTVEERLEMARAALGHIPNASAEAWEGLLVDFARERGACALVKGVRNGMDFEWEYQLAQINRGIHPELDTVLLPASPAYQHFSSSMAREMIRYRQPLEPYLPAAVIPLVQKMMEEKGE